MKTINIIFFSLFLITNALVAKPTTFLTEINDHASEPDLRKKIVGYRDLGVSGNNRCFLIATSISGWTASKAHLAMGVNHLLFEKVELRLVNGKWTVHKRWFHPVVKGRKTPYLNSSIWYADLTEHNTLKFRDDARKLVTDWMDYLRLVYNPMLIAIETSNVI